MNPIELLQKHCKFTTPYDCYVLLAVSRKKDTPEITNSQEIVFRDVIKNEEDIIRKYNKIKAQVTNYKDEEGKSYPFYLYVSLNRRDSKKASYGLMRKMLQWSQEESNGVDQSKMFKKIPGMFYSELMKPESRSTGQKYFMIDFDQKINLGKFLQELYYWKVVEGYENVNADFLLQETKNGYHIKLKAFDQRLLEPLKNQYNFEIKTDANLFVEYFKND